MKNMLNQKGLTTNTTILIAAAMISLAVLISGGVIKLKGFGAQSSASPTASAAPQASLQDKLASLAQRINLDGNKLKSCITSNKYSDTIQKGIADAGVAKIQGTPGFIIGKSSAEGKVNGVRVAGAYPYETFKAAFDGLLADKTPASLADPNQGLDIGAASTEDSPVLGKKDAPLTMIEFSDYECPFCKRHATQVLPSIRKDYIDTGKVKLVFRDFIAVPAHNPAATTEALAEHCAREQGGDEAYFKLHDLIYSQTQANGQGL